MTTTPSPPTWTSSSPPWTCARPISPGTRGRRGDRPLPRHLRIRTGRRAAIISGIPPYLLKTDQTPQDVPQEVFDQIAGALTADRFAYFTEWNSNFFNLDQTLGSRISEEVVRDAWNTAVSASPARDDRVHGDLAHRLPRRRSQSTGRDSPDR
jgi:hypothetical protein